MFSDNLQIVFQTKQNKTFTHKSFERFVFNKSETCFQTNFKRSFKKKKTFTEKRFVFNK